MKFIVFVASKLHGILRSSLFDRSIELVLELMGRGRWHQLQERLVHDARGKSHNQVFRQDPSRFLRSMAIVLNSSSKDEKGVLLIAYNYAFPALAMLFDLSAVRKRYHLVFEPSTARYLMPELLAFKDEEDPIFVQTGEPRDAMFLERFMPNMVAIPVAANWWIDSRAFRPDAAVRKDIDLIMVSSWLRLKRHRLLFKVLRELKAEGLRLTCCLVGYPADMTKEEIISLARSFGVLDQIEIHERITLDEVANLYRRARLNLLLSKREGFNRAIIEGMYCDIPCLIREGFNFGYKYPYINRRTGRYFRDGKLAAAIVAALREYDSFSPRKWLEETDMGAEAAARIVEETVYGRNRGVVVPKVSGLNGMAYWHKEDASRFTSDYEYLLSCCREQVDNAECVGP